MQSTEPSSTFERLLRAGEECIGRFGLEKTTMNDVAAAAGMSRQTVYRQFGSKDQLVTAINLRKIEDINRLVAERVANVSGPEEQIVEAVVTAVYAVRNDLVSMALMQTDAASVMERVSAHSGAVADLHRQRWLPILKNASDHGVLRSEIDMNEAVSWLVMLQISLIPWSRSQALSEADLRRFLEEFVIKGLSSA